MIREENGQTGIEYALLLFMVVVFAFVAAYFLHGGIAPQFFPMHEFVQQQSRIASGSGS